MDVVPMLKSKEAFVPCRNLSFGKRLSLTAMEKAAAFPLRAGFIPNSPMPMLDVCDWLLLLTVSTIGGGTRLAPFLFCWFSLLRPGCLLAKIMRWCCGFAMFLVGAAGGERVVLCVCVVEVRSCFCASSAVLNQHSLLCLV